ncbi:hypothetical protein [Polyangium mundeleinium]|uniref:Uncharacterized protein n=1 Tax=Polyangium mundeleinium TaxID=2995306 RepID=A0ABT5F6A5_9BACT|nr:hypothetical protein [Polyangium mundeleinium]MDC0749638.1 hypothetical protein [Polyangium mundeleinium]
MVPGGSIGAQIAIDSGTLAKGTPQARLGKAIGEIGIGLVQMALGVGGSFVGGGMSTTGGGAIVGVPIAVASAGMLVNGYAAVGVGWDGFWQAWSEGSGAGSGEGSAIDSGRKGWTHMAEAGRHVPRHTLAEAIQHGTRMPDPQGAPGAIKILQQITVNGKSRTLEIIYREADNTILHFLYK